MKNYSILLTVSILLVILSSTNTQGTAICYDNVEVGSEIRWEILNVNENATIQWWNLTSFRGAWMAKNDSLVTFNISTITAESCSGSISIGNLTLTADNYEIGSNLVLSVYPWNPGVISSTNWTKVIGDANKAQAGYNDSTLLVDDKYIYSINTEYVVNAIQFQFIQQGGGQQKTTLVYERDTGILLFARTEVNFGSPYILELRFLSSSINFSSVKTSTSTSVVIGCAIFPVAIGLLTIQKRRKRK